MSEIPIDRAGMLMFEITCPGCSATSSVKARPERARLRCVQCQHSWIYGMDKLGPVDLDELELSLFPEVARQKTLDQTTEHLIEQGWPDELADDFVVGLFKKYTRDIESLKAIGLSMNEALHTLSTQAEPQKKHREIVAALKAKGLPSWAAWKHVERRKVGLMTFLMEGGVAFHAPVPKSILTPCRILAILAYPISAFGLAFALVQWVGHEAIPSYQQIFLMGIVFIVSAIITTVVYAVPYLLMTIPFYGEYRKSFTKHPQGEQLEALEIELRAFRESQKQASCPYCAATFRAKSESAELDCPRCLHHWSDSQTEVTSKRLD